MCFACVTSPSPSQRARDTGRRREKTLVDALEIGYAIKEKRAELGLAQAELAEKAGISKRCLCSLELGQSHGVQLDKLTAVLGTLGLDLVISPASGTELSASSAVSTRPLNQPAAYSASVEDGSIDVLVMLTGTPRR